MQRKPVAYQRKTSDQRRQDLIEAGIHCLGEGGISNFTIDKICKQANVSRGLINHHFDTKDDLLLSIYDSMTKYLVRSDDKVSIENRVLYIINESFDSRIFKKTNLRAWLAIWGQVANNAELKNLHEHRYQLYQKSLSQSIAAIAKQRQLTVPSMSIARLLIALIDGLWLEYCLHSQTYSLDTAIQDCNQFLEIHLGPLPAYNSSI
jgi:TetR/AcrR family transcriptional repressor of bet genes